ncbi:MAG: 50S ribosomal protein L23 [Candidatus Taylorbacteria bacterium RIFCSPHIGHO2_02_FULL_44_36]|uniref:Large ribosomal subunit protein uL23 n=1 Tax=Candidatus Taylorbacteria bacterium RIFCSPLOWO2_12_FULL_44_15c TaxID=1802333 RepID=A0A1G2P8K0_9BACT|nr:MAG: 50S ribosomal protein L23 [Candidatus Taylorbacteria bacterium RIFCSPHIGHO2_02_FULL_44_36]OHA38607.1 MAG: 50S ribosomal protein L23 [Candidatus Taylorbacteria bacterium RIFCSPLOWO2_02_FULL_44_35]OHA43891.1 MAG: 50S ribosomal protein L23 [Candidatus Taylorbacteria bacterium RIFCSPLOWO2_12_FULL_44_15c]
MANIKIIRPRVTEKATTVAENGIHVFEVEKDASKKEIADAVKNLYKVSPIKINVVKTPRKQVFVRGKKGFKAGGKKAYVYLKKGEKIEII